MSVAATRTYALSTEIEFLPLQLGENLKEFLQKSYELYREFFFGLGNKMLLRKKVGR